ncbi:MAG: MFS transporter [Lachnospiraceae bacterium]|nr:MFS transporter [Lachnospiraceae bacterium]
MKNSAASWTIRYTLLNISYFVAFCTIHAYAAVYLLAHGFSNTEVGILLAVANIASSLAQPLVAGIIDKPNRLTNKKFIFISVLTILSGALLLMFAQDNKPVIFIVFALIYMIQFTYMPVMTALCFEYRKAGCNIVYGLARGLGSAGFAVTSGFIGVIVERRGVQVLLAVTVAAMAASALVILTFKMPKTPPCSTVDPVKADDAVKGKAHNNLKEFIGIYPAFSLFIIASVCFYFAHNMINDFMIQIIRELGGAEKELGFSNFLQALLELPVMALIGIVHKKVSSKALLLISGTAFLVKIAILVFARSMTAMYLSQSFQMLAYAVFIPATAFYVNETMEELDQVKGQAFITTSITLGGVFSNFISGRIIDLFSVRTALIVGTAVCAAGVAIAFVAMNLPAYRPEHTNERNAS